MKGDNYRGQTPYPALIGRMEAAARRHDEIAEDFRRRAEALRRDAERDAKEAAS